MDFYLTFGAALTAFSLLTAWMFISSRVAVWLRALAAAMAAALAVVLWTQAITLLGYPVPGEPPDNSTIIDWMSDGPNLYIWVVDKYNLGPRSYKLPDETHHKARKLSEVRGVGLRPTQKLVYHVTSDSIATIVSSLPPKNPGY